jgi:hypothetical protein
MTRRAHLVGSCPAPSAKSAMALMHATLGPWLKTLPTGEVGDLDWAGDIVPRRASKPELLVLKPMNYTTVPMRPYHAGIAMARPGHEITVETLNLDYAAKALRALIVLDEINAIPGAGRQKRLQVGIPGPFDLAAFTFGPFTSLYYEVECLAAQLEIAKLCELAGDRITFQLEVPLETYLVARTPRRLQHRIAGRIARAIRNFILACPVDSSWIIHWCYGDPHGQPLITPKSVNPLIELTNALIAHWPRNRELDAIGFPFASGTHAASNDANYYWLLKHMWLPETVTPIAGIVTEHSSVEDSARILKILGPRWGVSTPCGLGRRPNAVVSILEKLAALAQG